MKVIRGIALAFGVVAVAVTANFFYISSRLRGIESFQFIWYLLSDWPWPADLISLISNHGVVIPSRLLGYVILAVQIGAPVLAIILAKQLNRSRLVWLALTLFFPFSLAVLALLDDRRTSSTPHGGIVGPLVNKFHNPGKDQRGCLAIVVALVLVIGMAIVSMNMGSTVWHLASHGIPGALNFGILIMLVSFAVMRLSGSVHELFHPGPVKKYTNLDFDLAVGGFALCFGIYGLVVVVKTVIYIVINTFS